MAEWRFVASTFERGPWMRRVADKLQAFPLVLGKIAVWEHEWGHVLGTVEVTDPRYHQPHRAAIYEIQDRDVTLRFAAAEFSNGVWGFYLPGSDDAEGANGG